MPQLPRAGVSSPHEILGVEPDADPAEVVEAYRERVKAVHPDQGGSVEAFREVQRAYERIKAGHTGERRVASPGATRSRPQPTESRVAYLDYEVLDDYGWDIDDDDLFAKADVAGLDEDDYGEFVVEPDESILEAAEDCGYAWPYACRGGACSNCAIALIEGDVPPPTSHVLPPEMIDRGIRLSCLTSPNSAHAKIVYNVKHMPDVSELLLPASRFEKAQSTK